jgi:hypothetical protein
MARSPSPLPPRQVIKPTLINIIAPLPVAKTRLETKVLWAVQCFESVGDVCKFTQLSKLIVMRVIDDLVDRRVLSLS